MRVKVWLGVILSAGLLALVIYFVKPAEVISALRAVNPYYLPPIVLMPIVLLGIRTLRWRYLMEPVKKDVPVGSLFSATVIGFMANNVLPLRLGELARAYALGRRERLSKGAVFTTIVVERLFDGAAVLLLFAYTLAYLPPSVARAGVVASIHKAGRASFGLFIVVVLALVYFVRRPEKLTGLTRKVTSLVAPRFADKAVHMAESLVKSLGVVKDVRLLALIAGLTALHWGLAWTPVYLLFKAFGLHYGIYPSVYLLVVMSFSVALPSTPGYVGTFHAAVTGGLMLLGLDAGPAFSYALVAHATNVIPVTLLGFYYLYRENLSLKGLKKAEQV